VTRAHRRGERRGTVGFCVIGVGTTTLGTTPPKAAALVRVRALVCVGVTWPGSRSEDMAAPTTAPDTTTVARELDADPDSLRLFLDYHPNPTVEALLSAGAVGRPRDEIGEDLRDTLAAWVARERRQWYGPRDEILSFLDEHGPATENEITGALSHRNPRIVRPTVARLVRTGDIDREDRDDGPALFSL
jgi:hypothetical protein